MEILRAIGTTLEPRLEESGQRRRLHQVMKLMCESLSAVKRPSEVAIRPGGRQWGGGKRCRLRVANGRDVPPVVPRSASRIEEGGHHFIGETMILDLDRLRQPLILDTLEWVQPS
jgi:hypothetical protein